MTNPTTAMSNYIDGFMLPIPKIHVEAYKKVTEQVAKIWKEYGALAYAEYVCDDPHLEGTKSVTATAGAQDDEVVILGWVTFPSKAARDAANKAVPQDPRMHELIAPLINPEKLIFNPARMVYGGFQALVQV